MSRKYFISDMFCCFFFALLILSPAAYAAHPLITDDTGTQGKGKYQIEINAEFGYDKETEDDVTVKETGTGAAGILSYGISDNMDFVLGVPYQWNKVWEDSDMVSDEAGISDMSLELKWRFFETEGASLALKPCITLPTGDEEKGLGSGRISSGLTFIATKEKEPWAFHLNLAYRYNSYKLDEDRDANRKDIWHVSLASEAEVIKDLTVVANIGMEKNPDKTTKDDPAFILAGVIYSITDALDIDLGLKAGLNKPETDHSILTGTAFRF